MVDYEIACCMCGDVGFSDKLFRCSKCRNRFQHSYCSNYYRKNVEPIGICDWCQYEERSSSSDSRHELGRSSSIKLTYSSGGKTKQQGGRAAAEKATGKTATPRATTRRYKLLKDVMC